MGHRRHRVSTVPRGWLSMRAETCWSPTHGTMPLGSFQSFPVRLLALLMLPGIFNVTTLTGFPSSGFVDGPVDIARFNLPVDLALSSSGQLFIADYNNH